MAEDNMIGEELRKTIPTLILKALTNAPMHGYGLVRHIEQMCGGQFRIGEATIYPVLHSLEKKGLIVGDWDVQETGKPKRMYSLTTAGHKKVLIDGGVLAALYRGIAAFVEHH